MQSSKKNMYVASVKSSSSAHDKMESGDRQKLEKMVKKGHMLLRCNDINCIGKVKARGVFVCAEGGWQEMGATYFLVALINLTPRFATPTSV